jgi:t-SNARE complex subunit (syntaxin)
MIKRRAFIKNESEEQRMSFQSQTLHEPLLEDPTNAILLERNREFRELASDLTQLNEVMRDVHGLISEQGVELENAHSNVQSAAVQTNTAVHELSKASKYQSKARKKLVAISVCVILLIVGIILIVLWRTGVLTKSSP